MRFSKFGRVICTAALAGAALALPLMTGCNTDHPEAKITIEYNETTYVLEYKMYRNMYPQTVQHFIELADNGFYNDTIIHNYSGTTWYGGGYDYVENDELSYSKAYSSGVDDLRDYLEAVSKEKEYSELADPEAGKITPTVYRNYLNGTYDRPLNTLIGEFSNNAHKIESGALKSSYGCLRMYYSGKSDQTQRVYLNKYGSEPGVQGEYRYNSATSLFSLQLSTSTSSDSSYCIFGVLQNTDVLDSLKSDVSKNGSTKSVDRVSIDNYDEYLGINVNTTTYSVQSKPIIVRSVKITKY